MFQLSGFYYTATWWAVQSLVFFFNAPTVRGLHRGFGVYNFFVRAGERRGKGDVGALRARFLPKKTSIGLAFKARLFRI